MMNELQRRFFACLSSIQEACVRDCLAEYGDGGQAADMLYAATYEMTVRLLELMDGYSAFSRDRHDLVNTVTGEYLRGQTPLELHDCLEGFLRCGRDARPPEH